MVFRYRVNMFDDISLINDRQFAEKVLFAEDFVNYILSLFQLPLLSCGLAVHRAHLHSAFNTDVRLVANYFFKSWEEDMWIEYEQVAMNNVMNSETFFEHINSVKLKTLEILLPIEHGVVALMIFCTKISMIAAHFYIRGFKIATGKAAITIVDTIISVDMVEERGWEALSFKAAEYAQYIIDFAPDHLTPPETDWMSSDSSSTENSDVCCSPDQEMGTEEGEEEPSEKATDADSCQTCMAVMRSPSEEAIPSSSSCKHLESKMVIGSCSSDASSSILCRSSKAKSPVSSSHSGEEIYSEDDIPKLKIRKRRKKRPSYSYSKSSDSDSDNGKQVRKR